MTHRHRAQVIHARAAELSQCRCKLFLHEVNQVTWPVFSEGAETPQEGLSGKHCIGAHGDGSRNIQAGSYTAIHEQREPSSDSPPDLGQGIDRRRQGLDLAAPVIADKDTVDTQMGSAFRILRMKDSLDYERLFPAIPVTGDLVPREGASAFPGHKPRGLIQPDILAYIGCHRSELGHAVSKQGP